MRQRMLAACVVTLLLVCVPSALTAQDKVVRATDQASVLSWLTGIWGDVASFFGGKVAAAPPTSSASGDAGCMIDPMGCSQGG